MAKNYTGASAPRGKQTACAVLAVAAVRAVDHCHAEVDRFCHPVLDAVVSRIAKAIRRG